MSAVDPFATTGDDPFAEPSEAAAPPAPQPPVSPPEPTPPVPEPTPPVPEPTPPPQPADVPAAPVASEPTAADLEPTTPPEPGEPPVVNREGEPVAPSEPPQAPAAPPEAPEPTTTPTPAAPDASDNGTAPAADADAPEDPNAPKKGFRHYVVLYQTGPGQFTVAPLKDKHGKEGMDFIRRLTEPAEKEGDADVVNFYLEARNNDHAYRLCFTLFNRPADGVTVLPLPKASWRPRRVAPAPPAPERERLSIS